MKIRVDSRLCSGHARCNAVAPNLFRLNDEGYNDSDDVEVGEAELQDAMRGALACPEGAISILDGDRAVPLSLT